MFVLKPLTSELTSFVQLPVNKGVGSFEDAAAICPTSCLEDGWSLPVTGEAFTQGKLNKTNTFLASKARLDDDRMLKMKKRGDNQFLKGHFSVLERERMLGFPEGYVQEAGAL